MNIRVIYKLFLISALCFLSASFCYAQDAAPPEITLSYLSGNLPKTLVLKVKNSSYPVVKADMLKWLGESTDLVYNPDYHA